jgi:hypothetical protein
MLQHVALVITLPNIYIYKGFNKLELSYRKHYPETELGMLYDEYQIIHAS